MGRDALNYYSIVIKIYDNLSLLEAKIKAAVRLNLVEAGRVSLQRFKMTKRSPFRYFKTSPEIIRLGAMLYAQFPLLLRKVKALNSR